MDSKLLRQERAVVIASALIFAVSVPLDYALFPEENESQALTPVSLIAGILVLIGHAIWISMDRVRRGKEVGAWRFLTIVLAPLAIILYLIVEYRARALLYVPIYIGLLLGSGALGGLAAALLSRLGA